MGGSVDVDGGKVFLQPLRGPEFDAQIKKKEQSFQVLNYKVNDTGTNNGDVLTLQRKREILKEDRKSEDSI